MTREEINKLPIGTRLYVAVVEVRMSGIKRAEVRECEVTAHRAPNGDKIVMTKEPGGKAWVTCDLNRVYEKDIEALADVRTSLRAIADKFARVSANIRSALTHPILPAVMLDGRRKKEPEVLSLD